ncbi:hypothetical protein MRX96_058504 [Rhipicephalus microplus]
MRPVTTVATHRGRERRSTTSCQQQDHPVLNTPQAATSKGRGAEGDDDVSFTLTEPLVPNVPAYLTEAPSESSAVARPLRKPTRKLSPPSSATTEEEVTTIEAAPTPAARKSKGSSRRFLNSKEKEGKAARMNKSKGSREVRFQTEKVRRCEIISSEHTDKQHK